MSGKTPLVRVSCEFFPTSTDEGAEKLDGVRQALSVLDCEYFSVTYGAGGSTRERTLQTVRRILDEQSTKVMPHLTCVAAKRSNIESILDIYQEWGVTQLMALRGDMPSGMYQAGDLHNARELVSLVRERWGETAKIYVAAYPEIHPRSKTPEDDLRHFKDKVDAGANEAVTQYFYNVDAFLRFRDDATRIGVDIPIVPGVMPITNYKQLARFSDMCGAQIPRWIRKRLEAYQDNKQDLRAFGAEVVATMCARLIDEGVDALHFYSMNREDAVLAVAQELGWVGQ
ncbi:methylenetetrahydrofolate reductase [NAD(P)H] [Suttonella sp. R2A3]|uniref:methylenetetrahydrofolate reductase [NAD(P)H] n=1 Tax=Suttonella sp. R2A3 TaxID=2908648 RepID=UPI001F2DA5CC|nr:methylenetetrahydrofolate reductase [NAD(P)H] [Suttonella sp. R2A3]UJF24512.1 methylenetetrahydrofolate reductase [NAD(P)H] [Suttonella sp. R2A3]